MMSLALLLTGFAMAQDAPASDEPPAEEAPAKEPPTEEPPPTVLGPDPEPFPTQDEPEPTAAGDDDDDDADEEIIVYGEFAIAKARDALVQEMDRLGWRSKEKGDGTIKFRGPKGWMGSARFDPELANLDFQRSAAGFRLATYDEPAYTLPPQPTDPSGVANDAAMPSGAGLWLLPRKDKLDGVWAEVREATRDELTAYQEIVYATAFEERLQGIAGQLDALWTAGVPLEGSGTPVPEAGRTQVVVDFWAGRADTKEGLRMTKAVESWISNRLDSVPAEVQRQAEARRADGRAFPTLGD